MDNQPGGHRRHRVGRWLPHQDDLEDWLEGLVRDVGAKADRVTFHPVVEEFRDLIDRDPIVRMLVTSPPSGMSRSTRCSGKSWGPGASSSPARNRST
jgi:hypothetical protein